MESHGIKPEKFHSLNVLPAGRDFLKATCMVRKNGLITEAHRLECVCVDGDQCMLGMMRTLWKRQSGKGHREFSSSIPPGALRPAE